ncbi:NADH-quinone oxidoreductase subunit C [Sphingobacterium faecium NBRC 15299]|jgi:NADH-quinone oxidoreductase subunit C|uniref:NADH-quinone oxidoreductase subunit C n=1 Tax=Sphingobacterium faecium TaxID=34087 RepID=UPI000D39D150|nr:NADH-quinone oxidoreductase subunit C [Sphingobacterium faecium]PTX12354.1 NADH dehydrogenase subunit C [Sphingobacterium faecium]GEM62062.1 NADH-quinone oxidoreductase subunit C [Sphingobacterium faecium NBRC 15299]
MDKIDNAYLWDKLTSKFGQDIVQLHDGFDLLTVDVHVDAIIPVLTFLKQDEELQFIHLTDITAVHYPLQKKAFEIVYHVNSLINNIRIRVKVQLDGIHPEIPTATTIWKGANWMERETYDFYGIQFLGHPDLRRILNVDDMEVFPMRKEYPLEDPNRVDKKDLYFGR